MYIRAAFDIGSGATKLCVAQTGDQTSTPSSELRILYEKESEVLLGHALKRSRDNLIDDETVVLLIRVLQQYLRIVHSLCEKCPQPVQLQTRAIATAVFREAANGRAILKLLQQRLQLRVDLVTQAEEGRIGLLTAVASLRRMGKVVPTVLTTWDSGGASFQIVQGEAGFGAGSLRQLRVHEGRWGSSKATHAMLVSIQRKGFRDGMTCNPVTGIDARRLVSLLEDDHRQQGVPEWLQRSLTRSDCRIVGIGGPTSAFRTTALAARKSEGIAASDVDAAIDSLCLKSDADIAGLGIPQPFMAVPKMCLVLSVMRVFNISCFDFIPTTGGALGMIMDNSGWQNHPPSSVTTSRL